MHALGPARAARIHEALSERSGRRMSHTNVPTTLVKLTEKGLVRAKTVAWGKREYALYSLTPLGKAVYDDARNYVTSVMLHSRRKSP